MILSFFKNPYQRFSALLLLAFTLVHCSQPTMRRDPREWDAQRQKRRMLKETDSSQDFQRFAPLRQKLGILPFVPPPKLGDLGRDVATEVTKALYVESARSEKFVLAQGEAKEAFPNGSQDLFSGDDQVNKLQATRRGKDAGLSLLIFGKVNRASVRAKKDEVGIVRSTQAVGMVEIDIRIFDVQKAQVVFQEVARADTTDRKMHIFGRGDLSHNDRFRLLSLATQIAIKKSFPEVISTARKMTWRGRIAKIVGSRLYINGGRETGLQVGDILKVADAPDQIFDPDSGAYIGEAAGRLKGTLEIVDFFGGDGAVARIHSGGNFQQGDTVELY